MSMQLSTFQTSPPINKSKNHLGELYIVLFFNKNRDISVVKENARIKFWFSALLFCCF